ncbi:hypothetical protein MEG1DRAFT_03060 [Photorhabdus temperata subsp. temperata Meg1]|uniref:Uncharacterized protein n=1 Tax=Photorhabdus temperata subsp. temperata Meg1 TaxID=1393735 RepID=A0A081RU89_PHOTE|nr:hypothetical protein MEG1DRAFT_03060 [Photorhabdus temperata subsp. temperata Meg1]
MQVSEGDTVVDITFLGASQLPISRYFDVDIKNFSLRINHGLSVIVNIFPLPVCVRNPSVRKG